MPSAARASQLPPEERRRLASLLATGLIRLGSSLPLPDSPPLHAPQKLSETAANELATTLEQSVTGHARFFLTLIVRTPKISNSSTRTTGKACSVTPDT
jgi:hypothetical protein